jgi:hypothetical protein
MPKKIIIYELFGAILMIIGSYNKSYKTFFIQKKNN